MRNLTTICIVLILCAFMPSCKKINHNCMKGTVIGKIRSNGGGLAVSLDKKYRGSVEWQGHKNVIELLNIPEENKIPGTILHFTSRMAGPNNTGPITADGDESIELILYGEKFSVNECP